MNVRGVRIAVDCALCDGKGRTYPAASSRHQMECPQCKGSGESHITVSIATFAELMKPFTVAEGR
jgi:DnaJ-class molecular chaperone